jgi:hypothetical protein
MELTEDLVEQVYFLTPIQCAVLISLIKIKIKINEIANNLRFEFL